MVQTKKIHQNTYSQLLIGGIIAIVSSLLTILFQHTFSKQEKQMQLFLDEKRVFVEACNDYLKQYRQWYELMNYYVYKDSLDKIEFSEFNAKNVQQSFLNWKRDMDFAYGKIFLISDNDFGWLTFEISTELYNSITEITKKGNSNLYKYYVFDSTNNDFFGKWLTRAQEEIFRYNSGERYQKSTKEYLEELKNNYKKQLVEDSITDKMYNDLSKAYEYLQKDSLNNRRNAKSRMPTREEYKELLHQLENNDK